MAETIRIDGLKELEKTLREIAPKVKGNPLRNAVRAMANIVEKDAKDRAPVDTGRLQKSITKKLIPLQERDAALKRGDSAEGYDIGVKTGRNGAGYYWDVEAGTDGARTDQRGGLVDVETQTFFGPEAKGQPAQPFLRPALENNRHILPPAFAAKLKRSLELAAKNLAKNPKK